MHLVILMGLMLVLSACNSSETSHQHLDSTALPHNIPNFCANPTVTALQTGNWSNLATWSKALVNSDILEIPTGKAVTLDLQSNTRLKCLAVKGTLKFRPDVNTRLRVGTLMIFETGRLEIGTATTPIASNVSAEIIINNQALNSTTDPESYGTGILGFGRVVIHGEVKTSHVRLAGEPLAGQTTLTLVSTPRNWRASDKLVLPDTVQGSSGLSANEYTALLQPAILNLQAINGTTVNISPSLNKTHKAARNYVHRISFLPHLGNLTRNVIIRSENPAGTRGHVLFTHRANIDIRYTLFKDLGRTTIEPLGSNNQTGRYALHLHHLMGPTSKPAGSYQYILLGNAIDNSTKWGITIHNTHYGLVKNNIMYNTGGAGIMTEDGSESYNLIENNFAVYTIGTGSDRGDDRKFQNPNDWGWEGSGIWLRGTNNYVRNNIVANSNSFAYTFMPLWVPAARVPKFPGADTNIDSQVQIVDMRKLALLEFSGNTAYASRNGVTFWDTGSNANTTTLEVTDINGNIKENLVKNMRLWHINRDGFYGYGVNRVTFDNWVQRGDVSVLAESPYNDPKGLFFSDYPARHLKVINSDFQGLRTAIMAPGKSGDTDDVYGSEPGKLHITNSFLVRLEEFTPKPRGL